MLSSVISIRLGANKICQREYPGTTTDIHLVLQESRANSRISLTMPPSRSNNGRVLENRLSVSMACVGRRMSQALCDISCVHARTLIVRTISFSVLSCSLSTRSCKDCSSGLSVSPLTGSWVWVVCETSADADSTFASESSRRSGGAFFGMDVTANPRWIGFCCVFFFFGIFSDSGIQQREHEIWMSRSCRASEVQWNKSENRRMTRPRTRSRLTEITQNRTGHGKII